MITLNTIIYEGNFAEVLNLNSWFNTYQNSLITEKILIVNNITSVDHFNELKNLLPASIKLYDAMEYLNLINIKYNINLSPDQLGFYYTLPYFVALYNAKNPYLFNVSSDCKINCEDDFFIDSIFYLITNNNATSTTLPWRKYTNVNTEEQNTAFNYLGQLPAIEDFTYSIGFTDQVFLADVKKFNNIDYNTTHEGSSFYPLYGGNCFEKRVCSYHLNNNNYRLVYKKYYFIHNGQE